tara:strand:+ start:5 stop:514 length:510 start_codon:yes stop_codon:yes gene_type:complete
MTNKYAGYHENPGGVVQSNEWYTPPEVFTALKVNFDLDVASPKEKIPWLPTEFWFSKDDDGLKKDWFGFVWCNPPYGRETGLWLEKFIDYGNGIALVNSRTDTKWFHNYAIKSDVICFVKGRLAFYKPYKVNQLIQGQSASTGTLLLGCGDKAIQAIQQADLGYVVVND